MSNVRWKFNFLSTISLILWFFNLKVKVRLISLAIYVIKLTFHQIILPILDLVLKILVIVYFQMFIRTSEDVKIFIYKCILDND